MARTKAPKTQAIRALDGAGVSYTPHLYSYEERGGTAHSSAALGVPEHEVIKTLVMQDEQKQPLIVLMHGDCSVSTKELARQVGCKSIVACDPAVAQKHSGYQVGGTSPFGTRRPMPVYVEFSILELPRIVINGGKRGFLVEISPNDLAILNPSPVRVAIPRQ